jgi:predicted DNA binding CopG/RHH family protein
MKKLKVQKNNQTISPEEALLFIDSFQKMIADKDAPTKLISLRVPENLLNALKIKAKTENRKYQSMIIEMIRLNLKSQS